MTASEARSRVSKGALHLDQVRPGWAWQIDPGTLNLGHGCFCILGQLYGGYIAGTLHIPNPQGWPFGFDVAGEDYDTSSELTACYRLLQDCWIEEIANRLLPSSVEGQPAAVNGIEVVNACGVTGTHGPS